MRCDVLVARNPLPANLVRSPLVTVPNLGRRDQPFLNEDWRAPRMEPAHHPIPRATPDEIDPLYLFACQLEWEKRADPSAAWEVISAARSSNQDTRAHALTLLERVSHSVTQPVADGNAQYADQRGSIKETGMKTPYGLEIIESCMGCKASRDGFFCRFSPAVLRSMDGSSYHTVMPPGALLFVEGQMPRGVYVLCSGKVKLSTTSKDGKVLILKQAEAGEVLGLSAAISGTDYEMTAETCSPCQLDFIAARIS